MSLRIKQVGGVLLCAGFVVAAAIGLGSAAAPAATAPTGTLVLEEPASGSTFTHIRNTSDRPRRANRQGDLIVFTSRVVDTHGRRAGESHTSCVTTKGSRDFRRSKLLCTTAAVLRDGTFTGQFVLAVDADTTTGAITGGTGAYASARGTFVSRQGRSGTTDTITFAD